MRETRANLEKIRRRYYVSKRHEKTKVLDELCDIYDYNRKYLIQFFRGNDKLDYAKRGPKPRYQSEELLSALRDIWLATDLMCSKRLKSAIPLWLPFYEKPLPPSVKSQLLSMSPATIDRLLKAYRSHYKRHGLSGTKPGYLLKNQIPIKTDHWDVTVPGFVEADTVAHCGNSLQGDFIWSITLTDIVTCWTENRGVWNKGAEGVVGQIKAIEEILPFQLLGFDCDNGSEFLNWHLLKYFSEDRVKKVGMTRSRPYRKNDNAHVEQKNWSHVRHLLGYDRFDNIKALALINDLYANEWSLFQNHFMPTQKLLKKEKINSKYKKQYDTAKTPYERVLVSPTVAESKKQELIKIHVSLNPFELKKVIDKKLKKIMQYARTNNKPKNKI